MKLGILTDVHESLFNLKRALEILKSSGAQRLIFIGDVCRMCEDLEQTVAMLADAGVEGVWGNHDYGLCQHDPSEDLRARHSLDLLTYMQGLRPRLVVEDCHFTHVEPWLDAEHLEDLWWFEGLPESPGRLAQSFEAVSQRVLFVGHFHRWFLGTPQGLTSWQGESSIKLDRETRYLVGIHAVCEGGCAIYDTETTELTPFDLHDRTRYQGT